MRKLLATLTLALAPFATLASPAHAQDAPPVADDGHCGAQGRHVDHVVYDDTPGLPPATHLAGATIVAVSLDNGRTVVTAPEERDGWVYSMRLDWGRWLVYVILPAGYAPTSPVFELVTLTSDRLCPYAMFSGARMTVPARPPQARTAPIPLPEPGPDGSTLFMDEEGGVFVMPGPRFYGSIPEKAASTTTTLPAPAPAPVTPEGPRSNPADSTPPQPPASEPVTPESGGAPDGEPGVDMPGFDDVKKEETPEPQAAPDVHEPDGPSTDPLFPDSSDLPDRAPGSGDGVAHDDYEDGDMMHLFLFGKTQAELRLEDQRIEETNPQPPTTDEELDELLNGGLI